MRKILPVLSLVFLSTVIFAQNAKKAEQLLLAYNFTDAAAMYEKLIQKDPNKAEYHMNLGECYIRTPGRESLAVPELEKAVKLLEKKQDSEMFIDSKFLLGKAYHVNYEFDKAIKEYNELVINNAYKKFRSVDILQNEIRACEAAKEEFAKRQKLKVESPGEKINTEYSQHSPFFAENAGIFVYTSKELTGTFGDKKMGDGEYNENIFFIYIDNENDKEADPYDAPLNSEENESNCWLSKDGNNMLLHKQGDIYSSVFTGGKWSKPEKLKGINSKYTESHASMNQAMDIIYFSSDRPGGIGGKDIYFSKKEGGDKWSEPKLLGKNINTKFDEESPFIHESGTLYFSSKGHNSIGGYDIFSAEPSGEGTFQAPDNLGMPVNSVKDDLFFFMTSDKKRGYFMSKRPEGKGRADIYSVNFSDPTLLVMGVEGIVNNESDNMNSVKISSVSGKNTIYNNDSGNSETFSLNVNRGENYFISLGSQDHFFEAFTFSAPYDDTKVKNLGTINLQKINREKVHKVYSLNFEEGTNIDNVNYLFLSTLVDFLNENPGLGINLTSSYDKENNQLIERKQNIIDMLTVSGISDDRIFDEILSYDNVEGDVIITVLDINAVKNVAAVDDGDDNEPDNNVKEPDNNYNETGNYTIQLGAFERKIPNTHRFFKDLKGKVTLRNASDGLYHYTIGAYNSESEAERELSGIQRKGFHDAFVREINWYH